MQEITTPNFELEFALDQDEIFFIDDAKINGNIKVIVNDSATDIANLTADIILTLIGEKTCNYKIGNQEKSMREVFLNEELRKSDQNLNTQEWRFEISLERRQNDLLQTCEYGQQKAEETVQVKVEYMITCEVVLRDKTNWPRRKSVAKYPKLLKKKIKTNRKGSLLQMNKFDCTVGNKDLTQTQQKLWMNLDLKSKGPFIKDVFLIKKTVVQPKSLRNIGIVPDGVLEHVSILQKFSSQQFTEQCKRFTQSSFGLGNYSNWINSDNNLFKLSYSLLLSISYVEKNNLYHRMFKVRREVIDLTENIDLNFLPENSLQGSHERKKLPVIKLKLPRNDSKPMRNFIESEVQIDI